MRKFFTRSSGDSPQPSPTDPARPIRFVYCDEKGKFVMDPEAVATLQLVKGPVGVVSVCGRARQGKSYILNQLIGRSSGFQVASTHRPCTKGLWLWSAPIRRTALDGTEYNLLLLDSEGIDSYDQTGTYSTQIFSLAVLLSTMFIYNQMGGIDEAALDHLSLVTQMTKHIRVRAAGGRTTASELGQFSPIFVWLLRDFYLDLVEDNRKITPRDYLELALRPVQGGGRDIAAKNEIRESVRALFPDRECFTLVRPLSKENELQRLDQIPLDKLRPEFRSGLDALTRFVFERSGPKQVGATVMTGPILAGITQSFLDAINNGAVPTITSSWQSVEEAECQRACGLATEVYMSAFARSKPPLEAALREAHEEAAQKSIAAFNDIAIGAGSTRQKYEKRLQNFLKTAFEAAESKIKNYDSEISTFKLEIKELCDRLENANATAQSFEREARILEQEKLHLEQKYQSVCDRLENANATAQSFEREARILEQEKLHLEQKYRSEFNRFEEVQERCKTAEREAKRATELADNARAETVTAQKEKSEIQRIAMERLTQIERIEGHIETLERQKYDLMYESERYRVAEMDANSKVKMLEARVEERDKEIETLLKSSDHTALGVFRGGSRGGFRGRGHDRGRGRGRGGRDTRSCYYCGEQGHLQSSCWKRHERPTSSVVNAVAEYDAPPHSSKQRTNNMTQEEYDQFIHMRIENTADTPFATVADNSAAYMATPKSWVIDVGASAHMTHSTDTFSSYQLTSEHSGVIVANEGTLEVKGPSFEEYYQ